MDLAELGGFLRSRRDRLQPHEVGLPSGPRRRVPGLRRDEVAALAGASVEYYTELEQGAGAQPTEQMLAAIARALRLTADERDHIHHLAGRLVPTSDGAPVHVHPGMLDLLSRLTSTPAQVITDLHVTLVQNALAVALVGAEVHRTGKDASLIYRWFTDPAARAIHPEQDHDHHSRTFTADLRAAMARRDADDPEVRGLIDDLLRRSPEFAALWEERDVAVKRDDRKRIVHPDLGVVEVDCLNLFSEDGRQRLLWFAPTVGPASFEHPALSAVFGAQQFAVAR